MSAEPIEEEFKNCQENIFRILWYHNRLVAVCEECGQTKTLKGLQP